MPVMRLSGFSSGLDIETMVSKLMKAQRMPVDKLMQQKQVLEWKRDDYRSMNSLLMDLRSSSLQMKLQSTFLAKQATSSNDAIVSATATANATPGIYNIKINQLAASAAVTSGSINAADASATLKSLGTTAWNGDTTLTIGGATGTASIRVQGTDTIAGLVSAVNAKSSVTGVQLSYDTTMKRFFFVSNTTGAAAKVDLKSADGALLGSNVLNLPGVPATASGQTVTGTNAFTGSAQVIDSTLTTAQKFTMTYNGGTYDFSVSNTTTTGQLIDNINSSALGKAGVSAYLDSTGKLAFFNPDSTKPVGISTAAGNTVLTSLGLAAPTTSAAFNYSALTTVGSTTAGITPGKDALVVFNGVSAQYASNTFAINGLNFTAKQVDTSANGVNITVTQDTDKIFNSIKDFITKYNSTIDKINSKISEPHYRDYLPLSTEQKSSMKDNDIKLWEDKAKSGLLRGDSILSSALDGFRRGFYDTVTGLPTGDLNQLSQIGITTGAYQEKGKLYIDEAKLRNALATKPDQVMRLFTADDGIATSTAGDGFAVRLYNKANDVMTQLTSKAGAASTFSSFDNSLIGKDITTINSRISSMNLRLTDIENRYYKQFSAMETALSKMNSQSSWIASQMGR